MNILYLGILFIMFLCISLAWYQIMHMTTEESIVFSAIFIMLGVFLLGIFGKASLIYVITAVLSGAGVLAFLFNFSFEKEKKQMTLMERGKQFLSPSIVMLSMVFLYAIIAFRGAKFTYPDEFFQWGPAVKFIHDTGKLYYAKEFTGESITLSIATMFQYFWTGFGQFCEKNCIVGNFILAFIPIFLPFSGSAWGKWKSVFLYTVLVFLSLNILTYVKYYNLLQDFVLPLWAGSVIAWLLLNRINKINPWVFFGALMCIGSMKSMVGPLDVGIIFLVYIVNSYVMKQGKERILSVAQRIVIPFICSVSSGYIITFIWSCLLQQNVLDRRIASTEQKSIGNIIEGVIEKVFVIFSDPDRNPPSVSYFISFFVLLVIIYCMVTQKEKGKERTLYITVLSCYAIGFIGYVLIMIYAYVKIFSVSDSKSVAGLERYLAYYMILGLPAIASLLVKRKLYIHNKDKTDIVIIGTLMALIFATGNGFIDKATTLNIERDSEYKLRVDTENVSQSVKNLIDDDGKIFLLGNIDSTTSKCLMYELGSQYIWNKDCYKMYIRSGDESIIYCDGVNYPSLLETLHYSYIWCYNVSDNINLYKLKYYYGLQNIKAGDLYKLQLVDGKTEAVLLGNVNK